MTNALLEPEAPHEQTPEGLENYPAFAAAVINYTHEFDQYLAQLNSEIDSTPPEGYVNTHSGSPEADSANPHTAVAIFLRKHGAPVAFTKREVATDKYDLRGEGVKEEHIDIWISPEIEDGYKELWHYIINKDARRLANDMARGAAGITPNDAIPESYHVVPLVNRHILWAFHQGILQRSYVTSKITQYLTYGTNPEQLGSVDGELKLIESLMTGHNVRPLALETILGMGTIDTAAALHEHPDLITKLNLDGSDLPTADVTKIGLHGEAFYAAYDAYWKPTLDRIERAEGHN